jgi:ketosteroid isomerase-like protein
MMLEIVTFFNYFVNACRRQGHNSAAAFVSSQNSLNCIMKKILLSCLLLLGCRLCACAQDDRQAILNVLSTQQTDWNNGSIDGFMQGYWKSDSLVFVGKTAPVYGWKNTLERYKKAYPDKSAMGTLTFTIIKVELLDSNNAFVLGGWALKREKDSPGGYFTLWFKKIDGEWLIVCDHTS